MYKYNPFTGTFDIVEDLSNKADLVDWKVPSEQLPSYVDDVIEVANFAALPLTWEQSKIYVTLDDNKNYRWSGTAYILLNPVDLSNYYNKTEVNNSLALTQLNSLPVLLNTNTVVNTSVYDRNKVFVCSWAITIDIDPTLSANWTEYTFINLDDSIITLNPTAAKAIWNYTTSYKLTNKWQSITLVKRSNTLWDIKNEFTDWNKKIAIQFNFSWQALTTGASTYIAMGSTTKDSWMITSNEKTNACLSYNSWLRMFTVNKEGWYEFSWYIMVFCFFWSIWAYLISNLDITGWVSSGYWLGTMYHQIGSASESSSYMKTQPFSAKVYLNKNTTFKFNINLSTTTYNATLSAGSRVTIEYLGN